MNKYETIIIINPTITDTQRNTVIEKIKKHINKNGEITNFESLGVKKLAYEIRKQKTGDYYVIEFKAESNSIAELERLYRITDEIIKFIIIRKED